MAASLVPTEGGNPIPLDKPIILIGRNQECDIWLRASSKVSRRHCCIVQCGERFLMRDLGSMNGVRVNSRRIVEAELKTGDEVAVADVCFRFKLDDVEVQPSERLRQQPQTAPSIAEALPLVSDDRDLLPIPLADEPEDIAPDGDVLPPKAFDEDDAADQSRRLSDSETGFARVGG